MKKKLSTFVTGISIGLLFTLGACDSRDRIDQQQTQQKKFIVAVVGDGVPSKREPCPRATSLNRAQGKAMWDGVYQAFHNSPTCNKARELISLVGFDDCGTSKGANKIARELQWNPRVLAVIGHATSGTTRAAGWIYSQAGIPLLMPIATSPNAVYPPGVKREANKRLQNCFRLPPSDDRVQAPAVAYVARIKLGTKRCFLLQDVSEDAVEYSEPLNAELEILLADVITDKRNVDRKKFNLDQVARSIKAYNSDVVVFCGYGTTATELLDALREVYDGLDLSRRPKVILTDGCNTKELDLAGFQVYLTFPVKEISQYQGNTPDFNILKNSIKPEDEQSYQIYGYDAMTLIAYALERCSAQESSRSCLTDQLNQLQNFSGACFGYSFVGGENILSSYHVYLSDPSTNQVNPHFEFDSTIPPDDIVKISALREASR